MSHYISHMFGIRLGGVFSDSADMVALKTQLASIVCTMRAEGLSPDLGDDETGDVSHCLSQELEAHKGSYAVIAGVFNYWDFARAGEFARRVSEACSTDVMHMCWDEQRDTVQCQIWLAGKPLFESYENAIGRILRRVAS